MEVEIVDSDTGTGLKNLVSRSSCITNKGTRICVSILAILLTILSDFTLLSVLALGAWGVYRAQTTNPCSGINITATAACSPVFVLTPSSQTNTSDQESTVDPQLAEAIKNYNPLEYTHWLGAASGVGVLWAVMQTFAGVALIELFKWIEDNEASIKKCTDKYCSCTTLSQSRIGEDSPDGGEPKIVFGGKKKRKSKNNKTLRTFSVGAAVGLFFSLLFFVGAVLCILWGIAIAFNNTRRNDQGSVTVFVVVELLVAVFMPIFFFLFGILLSGVLAYITCGKVDMRTHIPIFLSAVKHEVGTKTEGGKEEEVKYWVIEDLFYFEQKTLKIGAKSNPKFIESFEHSWATWFFNVSVCLGIHLAVSYFVDVTLDTQLTLTSPSMCDRIDSSYQCFSAGDLLSVECMKHNGTIHCFKFYGVDVDLISALTQAFAFYLVTSAAFSRIFSVVKICLQIKLSKWWGIGFVLLGALPILAALGLVIAWIIGYVDPKIEEILHFNVINLAQYVMVCVYIMIVGLLLLMAEWWEGIDTEEHLMQREMRTPDQPSSKETADKVKVKDSKV